MKLYLALAAVLALAIVTAGCGKQSAETPPATPQTSTSTEQPTVPVAPAAPAKPKAAAKGFKTTKSGLQYKDTKVGKGPEAKSGSSVEVLYTGSLDDGTVFDASSKHGNEPIKFTLGQGSVIKGWDEGLQGVKVGGVRQLTIPPDLGYGNAEQSGIPANSTLHFEVKLVSVDGKK